MRRLLSTALLLLISLPLVAPLLAQAGTSDSGLPACCRRNGRHHCAMSLAERARAATPAPRASAPQPRCPYAPATLTLHTRLLADPPPAWTLPSQLRARNLAAAPARGSLDSLVDAAHPKRGPPATSLL